MLTAKDALEIVAKRAQWCRENGESDMRNILSTVRSLKDDIDAGRTRDEILAAYENDQDE